MDVINKYLTQIFQIIIVTTYDKRWVTFVSEVWVKYTCIHIAYIKPKIISSFVVGCTFKYSRAPDPALALRKCRSAYGLCFWKHFHSWYIEESFRPYISGWNDPNWHSADSD